MHETPRVVDNGNIGPVNSTLVPRYSGEATFALLPRLRDLQAEGRAADIKIVGAPFDTGVSYRPRGTVWSDTREAIFPPAPPV